VGGSPPAPFDFLEAGGLVIDRSTSRIGLWIVAGVGVVVLALTLSLHDYRINFLQGSGIAEGSLIAAIALGVVLTYRGSGVVNFANGAIAMYVAYVYAILRIDGDLFLPPIPNPLSIIEGIVHKFGDKSFSLPDIPTTISFGQSMSFWPALLISLAFCVLFGLILHFLIFRPLRHAPPLAKVVASIGLLIYIQAVVIRRFTLTPRIIPHLPYVKTTLNPPSVHLLRIPPAGTKQVDLFLFSLNQDKLVVLITVLIITGALSAAFKWTRFGLATRAAAENEKGAVVLGFSPDFLAGTNWVLSTLITGLLGIFAASTQSQINPIVLPALIVPAVIAALVGAFRSFWITTAAAFLLGMQTPLVQHFVAVQGWLPRSQGTPFPGVERVLPIVVIVLILYIAGNALPERGAISAGRLPFSPTPPRWALWVAGPVLALVTAYLALFWLTPNYRIALSYTLVGVIICLSVVVITGFVGQISLAQMAFAGISAFLVSHLTSEHNWPFPAPIFAGAVVAAIVGLLLAIPALRVRGVNLAIVTFAFAVAVDDMVFANKSVIGLYGGASVKVPDWIDPNRTKPFHFLGIKIGDGTQPNPMTAIFCLIAVVILCYLVANLRRSATGRKLLSIRSNERAAAAAGVNVSGTKVLAFAISAFIAGIGGAVLAYQSGNATSDKFDYTQSLLILAFAYLGGVASVSGAIVGGTLVASGLVFTFLDTTLHVSPDFTLMLGGIGLIISAILNPEGIAGGIRELWLKLARRLPPRGSPKAASAPAPTPAPVTEGVA
jgi:branched-chain amino acid transport system permease protein